LLPILGRPYGEALEAGEIQLAFDADGFFFTYFDKRLPLAPQTYQIVLRECVDSLPTEGPAIEVRDLVQNDAVVARFNGDFDLLDRLLDGQWYRLAYWRTASETINYRRFFDVTDLVGLKVENAEVFEARNRRVADLIGEGMI